HLGADVLKSMKEGKFASDKWTPEVSHWLARAGISFWLKRWDKLYDEIVANLSSDPEGTMGEKIASDWRNLIVQHLCVPPIDLAIGVILWQELGRNDSELKEAKKMPTPEELAKKVYAKLLFNPDALCWIEKALLAHPKS
ncbi:MAG TPA: MerR family transcriptional regulator, partial [Myxococcota bacterium]|nr:MerR family transcriptional regulator [Myxococcota bacterium]